MTMIDALNRTLLLMRSDLKDGVSDERLLDALRSTRVILAADEATLSTHSGQSAYIAAATMMARSAHSVFLVAPEVPILGAQPPLVGEYLIGALHELGRDLLPQWTFEQGEPGEADLAIVFGSLDFAVDAGVVFNANASDWACEVSRSDLGSWRGGDWPIGGLAAATVAAGEAFKAAMRKLREWAKSSLFDDLHAPVDRLEISLAEEGTPKVADLGAFEFVSAGAIGNAALHILLRVPGVTGNCRMIDHDLNGLTNLNRNALLRHSRLDMPKVEDIASYGNGVRIEPVPHRFAGQGEPPIELGKTVLVGVDHIPSRWAVQASEPDWLGIGGTEGFSVQMSWHEKGLACARCLHPANVPQGGEIPTCAFVSYWAGLILAATFLRLRSGRPLKLGEQQAFLSALRPESWGYAYSGVNKVRDCPNCADARRAA
jgi:molybdopterin/thiamine biosynthesis adenylyltransferase